MPRGVSTLAKIHTTAYAHGLGLTLGRRKINLGPRRLFEGGLDIRLGLSQEEGKPAERSRLGRLSTLNSAMPDLGRPTWRLLHAGRVGRVARPRGSGLWVIPSSCPSLGPGCIVSSSSKLILHSLVRRHRASDALALASTSC